MQVVPCLLQYAGGSLEALGHASSTWKAIEISYFVMCFVDTDSIVDVIVQQSMVVPQTPLHTSRVLKEEQDVWEEVKVSRALFW